MDRIQESPERVLMRDMGLNEVTIERRKRLVGLSPSDLVRIAAIRDGIGQRAEELTESFFDHLATLDEAKSLMEDKDLIARIRRLKREHLLAMVQGDYGSTYVEQRLKLAILYGKAAVDTRVFLGAFHHLLSTIGRALVDGAEHAPREGFENFVSLKKVAFFDIGLIVDALVFERERTIRQQQESIRELSTPVLQVRDRMLLVPIIGVIDTLRARLITDSLLRAIRTSRARVVVMDVTGVATIDSRVANHLFKTITAARLMGAHVIVSGLSSDVAQSLVSLGIDLERLNTVGDLQGGIEEAEHLLRTRMMKRSADGAMVPEA